MHVLRFLDARCVRLGMETRATEPVEDETEAQKARRERHDKERAITEIAQLLDVTGAVVRADRLARDLDHRERKATTGILPGIAIPHVRTLQARRFVMGFLRADEPGLPFAALDGEPVRLFFPLVSPPYEDRTYLQVYRELAQVCADEDTVARLLAAEQVNEVFNALREVLEPGGG